MRVGRRRDVIVSPREYRSCSPPNHRRLYHQGEGHGHRLGPAVFREKIRLRELDQVHRRLFDPVFPVEVRALRKRVPLKFWNYTIFKHTMRRITGGFLRFFNSKSRLVPSAGVLSVPPFKENSFADVSGRPSNEYARRQAPPVSRRRRFPSVSSVPSRCEKKLRKSFRGAFSCFSRIQLIPSALSQGKPVHASCPFKSFIASRTKIRSRCAFPDNPARTDS